MASEIKMRANRQRYYPTHHELLASNKLEAANIKHNRKFILGFFIYDLFIPNRCLLIDIDADHDSRDGKAKLAAKAGFTYLNLHNKEVATIGTLLQCKPYEPDWFNKNKTAFEKVTRLIDAAKLKANK